MKVPVMVPSSQWHWCRCEKPTAGMVKPQFFLGIYNVEMHQNVYPFQTLQTVSACWFSIHRAKSAYLGPQPIFDRQKKELDLRSFLFCEAFTAFRHLRELCWEMLRKGLVSKVDRKLGDWFEEAFFLFVFKIVWFIQLDLIRVSGFLSILTKYQSESSPSDGRTCIFCSHQMDLRQWHPPSWSSQATEKYAQVAWLKY